MTKLTPRQIFIDYQNKEIDKKTSIYYLKTLLEESDDENVWMKSFQILEKMNLEFEEILKILENLIISDTSLKKYMAETIANNLLGNEKGIIEWLISKKSSIDFLVNVFQSLTDCKSEKARKLLEIMVKNIGGYYIEKYNIIPREAVALGLMDRFLDFKFSDVANSDYGHAYFKKEENYITELYVNMCGTPEMSCLKLLQKLKRLEISGGEDIGDLEEITGLETLVELEELDFYNNRIKEIKGLDTLTRLKDLNLSGNEIKEIQGLGELVNLEILGLAYNPISKLKGLENLKNLRRINFEYTNIPEEQLEDFYPTFIWWVSYHHPYLDLTMAIKKLNRAVKLEPEAKYAWYYLGNAYMAKKNYDNAINSYQAAIKLDNQFIKAINGLAHAFLETKDYNKAIRNFERIIKLESSHHRAWNYIGVCYLHLNDFNKAVDHIWKSININPNYKKSWYILGRTHERKEETDKAIEAYLKAIKIYSRCREAWFRLGNIYRKLGRKKESLNAFESYLKIYPFTYEEKFRVAEIYVDMGYLHKAFKLCELIVERRPGFYDAIELKNELGSFKQEKLPN